MKVVFDEIDHFHPNFDESVPKPFTLSLCDTVNNGHLRPTNIQIELMKVCVYQIPRGRNRLRSWRFTIITDSGCFSMDEMREGQQDWKRSLPHGLVRPVMYQWVDSHK